MKITKEIVAFESFVNSEECKTKFFGIPSALPFESFVNSEECKTTDSLEYMESSV